MTVNWCRILKWFTGLSVRLIETIFECKNFFLFNKYRRNVRMFNNILVQSAQAMLAQANQVPQGVLQLLQ